MPSSDKPGLALKPEVVNIDDTSGASLVENAKASLAFGSSTPSNDGESVVSVSGFKKKNAARKVPAIKVSSGAIEPVFNSNESPEIRAFRARLSEPLQQKFDELIEQIRAGAGQGMASLGSPRYGAERSSPYAPRSANSARSIS